MLPLGEFSSDEQLIQLCCDQHNQTDDLYQGMGGPSFVEAKEAGRRNGTLLFIPNVPLQERVDPSTYSHIFGSLVSWSPARVVVLVKGFCEPYRVWVGTLEEYVLCWRVD
jgi:hypothetical protein